METSLYVQYQNNITGKIMHYSDMNNFENKLIVEHMYEISFYSQNVASLF